MRHLEKVRGRQIETDYARNPMINILRDIKDKIIECYAKGRDNGNSDIY